MTYLPRISPIIVSPSFSLAAHALCLKNIQKKCNSLVHWVHAHEHNIFELHLISTMADFHHSIIQRAAHDKQWSINMQPLSFRNGNAWEGPRACEDVFPNYILTQWRNLIENVVHVATFIYRGGVRCQQLEKLGSLAFPMIWGVFSVENVHVRLAPTDVTPVGLDRICLILGL